MMFLSALGVAAGLSSLPAAPIHINDNVRPAGHMDGSVLTVHLVAAVGQWQPEGPEATPLDVAAFGEEGSPLSVPGPLIRARQGTTLAVSVNNAFGADLRVFGLCAKPGPCEPIAVAAGTTRELRLALNAPGTFYYWASTSAQTITARPRRESQLGGALVVDPPDGAAADRVMVISIFDDGRAGGDCTTPGKDAVFTINGASWPHTTRLRYQTGNVVRWRVINLSCDLHAMHLHGFHFTIDSDGDGTVDRPLAADRQRTAVTEPIPPGRTFTLSWIPTRAGNWLFHCHMVPHMTAPAHAVHAADDGQTHAGMAGLVVGIEVAAPAAIAAPAWDPARRFSLVLREESNRYGNRPGYRMDLEGTEGQRLDPGPVPGPVIVLRRDEPVEITIVNRMAEPTAIHWHGIEIESYYDGVPGFGGTTGAIASPVEAGQSFVVKLKPPRAGTFIYHTHWHDEAQLAGGLYGALLVLDPGEKYDPELDHVVVIGLNGVVAPAPGEPFALNGRATPEPVRLRAGVPNRLRLINITPTNVGLAVLLVDAAGLTEWTPIAKDGAALPAAQRARRPARQPVAVGETYDFEVAASQPRDLSLEVRRANGVRVLVAPVQIR